MTISIGARVYYVAPYLRPDRPLCRPGIITAISGVSALVLYEDYRWPQWAPLDRLQPVGIGWVQPLLLV